MFGTKCCGAVPEIIAVCVVLCCVVRSLSGSAWFSRWPCVLTVMLDDWCHLQVTQCINTRGPVERVPIHSSDSQKDRTRSPANLLNPSPLHITSNPNHTENTCNPYSPLINVYRFKSQNTCHVDFITLLCHSTNSKSKATAKVTSAACQSDGGRRSYAALPTLNLLLTQSQKWWGESVSASVNTSH